MKTRSGPWSAFKDFLAVQWHGPPKPDDPSLVPSWRFLQAMRPVVNALGVFFAVCLVIAVVMLVLNGCHSPH